jgi:hypothetical protein
MPTQAWAWHPAFPRGVYDRDDDFDPVRNELWFQEFLESLDER